MRPDLPASKTGRVLASLWNHFSLQSFVHCLNLHHAICREAALAAKDAELQSLCKELRQREAAIDAKSARL